MVVLGMVFLLNIIIMNLFPPVIEELVFAGYAVLGIGILFFILSIFTLLRNRTYSIVKSGIYSIVRHPMYLGGILMFFSHIFFGQNWIILIGTILGIVCCYLIIILEDQRNIEKFGNEYRVYMKKVPRINLLSGIIKKCNAEK